MDEEINSWKQVTLVKSPLIVYFVVLFLFYLVSMCIYYRRSKRFDNSAGNTRDTVGNK